MCIPFLVDVLETPTIPRILPARPPIVAFPEEPSRETPVFEEPTTRTDPEPEEPVAETPQPEPPPPQTDPEPEEPVAETPQPESTGRELLITDNMPVAGGRVSTLETGLENLASIEITGKPEAGNLTVNPDNTLALVLTGTEHSGPLSFQYTATFEDGTTETFAHTVDVELLELLGGWPTGESIYMLETDANGDLVIEHGDNHRVVHLSGSEAALSRADIALIHDLQVSDITVDWLLDHPEYGATPDLALDQDLGSELWFELNEEAGSHWLLLERGYDYDFPFIMWSGESELHPRYIGAYGEGSHPRFVRDINKVDADQSNWVLDGIEFTGNFRMLKTDNLIMNDLLFDNAAPGEPSVSLNGIHEGGLTGITFRNSTVVDAIMEEPSNGEFWTTGADRIQGVYAHNIHGFLFENNLIDHTGWEENYEETGLWNNGEFGQWPSKMSQNLYFTSSSSDSTIRENITMRAAHSGLQARSGGYVEDNVFLDNNDNAGIGDGDELPDGRFTGNFSLVSGNVITSGAAKMTDEIMARSFGLHLHHDSGTALGNIVAHLADPNNPDEFAEKIGDANHTFGGDAYFNDTILYNWVAQNFNQETLDGNAADRNVDGLDPVVLDQTTIQLFTADLLGQPTATIDDLGQHLRDPSSTTTAQDIIDYFRQGFGIYEAPRQDATTLRFVPNDLGDGVRWDNRINWTTGDLPGTVEGDSVNLGGNWVTFATSTGTVEDLALGSDGRLNVTSGRLNVEGETTVGADGGEIDISNAGQLWLTDYHDDERLDIDVESGRFANSGFFDGLLDMHVRGGQAILGVDEARFELNDNSVLTVEGAEAKIGFDGEAGGVSVLRMETSSELRMVADGNGFSAIREFRSGAHDNDAPNVLSAFDMGEGTLLIDVAAIAGGAAREETLVDTDEVVGMFDNVEFVGLGADQDATLTVDYETDRVTVSLGQVGEGSGRMSVTTVGDMMNAAEDTEIWAALTEGQGTYEELDATTPEPRLADEEEDDMAPVP